MMVSGVQITQAAPFFLIKSIGYWGYENTPCNQFARKLRNEIHALSQCGFGYSDIAREFNHLGITTFTGKRWYPQTVKNVIRRIRIHI